MNEQVERKTYSVAHIGDEAKAVVTARAMNAMYPNVTFTTVKKGGEGYALMAQSKYHSEIAQNVLMDFLTEVFSIEVTFNTVKEVFSLSPK